MESAPFTMVVMGATGTTTVKRKISTERTGRSGVKVCKMLIVTMVIQQWRVKTLICFKLVVSRSSKQSSVFYHCRLGVHDLEIFRPGQSPCGPAKDEVDGSWKCLKHLSFYISPYSSCDFLFFSRNLFFITNVVSNARIVKCFKLKFKRLLFC